MSAVLAAVFTNHAAAEHVRTRLVKDGFPTDRVELTSRQELGQATMVPTAGTPGKLAEYFRQLFPSGPNESTVQALKSAVLSGQAVVAVQPRGEIETQRAMELLSQGDPLDVEARDLQDQALEHAAAADESSGLAWIGKILIAGPRPG